MNWAWWDGKVTIELYTHEHGLDHAILTEAISENGQSQNSGKEAEPVEVPHGD